MAQRKNLLLISVIATLAIGLIASIALFIVSLNKNAKLNYELASKCDMINSFAERSRMPLTENSVTTLEAEKERLNKIFLELKPAIQTPGAKDLNRGTEPLYFKERLIQTQKKLRKEALSKNLILPDSLGFLEYESRLSQSNEIPALVIKLQLLEALINMAMEPPIASILSISFEPPIDEDDQSQRNKRGRHFKKKEEAKPKEEAKFFSEVPVTLKISCTIRELIDFMYKLRGSAFNIAVENLDITSTGVEEVTEGNFKKILEVKFQLTSILLNQ